ncbi:transmembrane protein 192 [Misgurnus anguillicaudatus]|uniref:transmembrane protein 192 n=1 Tax=Misgurnus anguillicaudatus TaxID=75329 RepID=UPI003CCFC796
MESGRSSTHGISNVEFTQSTDEEPLIDGPVLSQDALESAIRREFQTLPTHWAVGVLSFLHVVYVALCVVITVFCWISDEHSAQCTAALQGIDSKSLVVLGKVALWVFVFIYDRFVQHHHNAVRRRGYLNFYRMTRGMKSLPLLIYSAGNAAMLTVIASSSLLDAHVKNLSVYLLLTIICLELLLSIICLIKYAVHVVRFNSKKPRPDVNEEERSFGCSSDEHTETGFRDGSSLEEVVEKQADLIDYLKHHNTLLNKRILTLSAQQIRQ